MEREIVQDLRRRRKAIRERWEAFLRLERVASPLANPDTLVFGLDRSLSEIFSALLHPEGVEPGPGPIGEDECACGRQPLRAYYRAGEQAVLEALVLAQAERAPHPEERDREFAEVKAVVSAIAWRDLEAFARVCQLTSPTSAGSGAGHGATGGGLGDPGRGDRSKRPKIERNG